LSLASSVSLGFPVIFPNKPFSFPPILDPIFLTLERF
jgi:hypothetical protein